MRLAGLALALVAAACLAADDPPRSRVDLDVVVPVRPEEHERLHFFDGRLHHVVPGTVTINGSPYECDAHRLRFSDRERFVAHLQREHAAALDRLPEELVTVDGRVHYVGR